MFWLWVAAFVAVSAFPAYLLWRDHKRLAGVDAEIDLLELDRPGVALLTGGPARVADALVTDLVERGVLAVHPDARGYLVLGDVPVADEPAVAEALVDRVREHGARLSNLRDDVARQCHADLLTRYEVFRHGGLVTSSSARGVFLLYGYPLVASLVAFVLVGRLADVDSEVLDARPLTMITLCFGLAIVPGVLLWLRRDSGSWPHDPRTRMGKAIGARLSERAADSLDLAPVVAARGLSGSDEVRRSILGAEPVGAWDMFARYAPDDDGHCRYLTKEMTWHKNWNARG
ncbi:TIGR04222 domain-containing membrane protein [Actinokineospora sp. NBRC 105648]|uniref:TIGR04222 domain-containing membrane protein n=1 Tax=Actinokineospora sp. NBRC 105648 TaxID=3032206 RepID=UPI0024A02D90|nr:TIGR04222 domain-containing membrane protein [Actinokineospora sp. NBRC 105648]GLZ40137.1 hypothetical protein Acsp05_37610 [Actinokineospora sp. NBRC 105648]